MMRLSGLQRDASGHSVLWHAVAFGHWGLGAWIGVFSLLSWNTEMEFRVSRGLYIYVPTCDIYIYICVYHGIKYKLIVLETGDRCVIANFNAFTRSKWLKLQLSFSDLTSKLPSYSSRC